MTFQPGVVVKDYTWNNQAGYLFVNGTKKNGSNGHSDRATDDQVHASMTRDPRRVASTGDGRS
jgi:hypothetical protein